MRRLNFQRPNGIEILSGTSNLPEETAVTTTVGTGGTFGPRNHHFTTPPILEFDRTDDLPDRYNLEDAVASRQVRELDPADLSDVPVDLIDAIARAHTILLIGHIHPDSDCVGSTLALARALRTLGKRVDVCIDDQLSHQLRNVDDQHQVKTAGALSDGKWDLAVVMDTMVPSRLGGAIELLGRANEIGLVDHHEGTPDRTKLGVRADQPLHAWINPDYAAAALMSAALIGQFDKQIAKRNHAQIYEPALAGFATDTRFGELATADRTQFGYFKFMARRAGLPLAKLRSRLDPSPPANVAAIIEGHTPDLSAPLVARLAALRSAGAVLRESNADDRTIIEVPKAYFELLLDVGRAADPCFNELDLSIAFKEHRDQRLAAEGGLAAVLFEEADGVTVSLRVDGGDLALQIARDFNGGGHKTSAASFVPSASLENVREGIESFNAAS